MNILAIFGDTKYTYMIIILATECSKNFFEKLGIIPYLTFKTRQHHSTSYYTVCLLKKSYYICYKNIVICYRKL